MVLVDFLCHGTGTQKVFDLCIKAEEKKKCGKIESFVFRSKAKKAEHSFTYTIKTKNGGASKDVSGYSFEFPFYYSFLKYTIFNDACYSCKYACASRVGDITLGDFWGIQKYDRNLKDYKGVSMISVNSEKGRACFERVKDRCSYSEYPIGYASDNNQSFREPVRYPEQKKFFVDILTNKGEDELIKTMSCPNVNKAIIYHKTPKFLKKFYNMIRGR